MKKTDADARDAALSRLADGSYGICESCGIPMDSERLRAIPEARRCMPCEVDDSYTAQAQRYVPPERGYATASSRSRRRGRL